MEGKRKLSSLQLASHFFVFKWVWVWFFSQAQVNGITLINASREASLQVQCRTVEPTKKVKEKFPKQSHNFYPLYSKPLRIANKQISLLHLVPTSEKELHHLERP